MAMELHIRLRLPAEVALGVAAYLVFLRLATRAGYDELLSQVPWRQTREA